jgi:3-methyladenine DNA glycosylase AlkC
MQAMEKQDFSCGLTKLLSARQSAHVDPVKNVFHQEGIALMSAVLARHVSSWDSRGFVSAASEGLEALELKARSEQIYQALCQFLPADFSVAATAIRQSLHPALDANASGEGTTLDGIQGWLILPLTEFAGRQGSGCLPLAMDLLMELTMRFTSEFGIRHLWLRHPDESMALVSPWVHHKNEHVRRLVSEGSRPRLPWGLQLNAFIEKPQSTWHLLEALRDDPSAYVRKSVANHLNDNARDHPELVMELACEWHRNAPSDRQRLIRHALRNLLKQGHPQALALYQFGKPQLQKADLSLSSDRIAIGQNLEFRLEIRSRAAVSQSLRLDYVIHHQKAKGSMTPKVFRWKDLTLDPAQPLQIARRHSFRVITTRVYHPGIHRLEIKANGEVIATREFFLQT